LTPEATIVIADRTRDVSFPLAINQRSWAMNAATIQLMGSIVLEKLP
jgi:hypothetical protein